jgi:hypothetical protein
VGAGQLKPFDYGDFLLKSARGTSSILSNDSLMDIGGVPVVEAKVTVVGYKFLFFFQSIQFFLLM